MTFVFVGSSCELPDGRVLDRFGAEIELPKEEADGYISQNVALVPKSAVSFTAGEQEKYHAIPLHVGAPADFLEKRAAAWRALHAYRESLSNPPVAEKEGE